MNPENAWPDLDLDAVHGVYRRWLGEGYDLDVLHAVLAAAAVERLDGDPLWLIVVSGSGAAKTETVQALEGSGAIVTSTIASEGALLSGTSKRDAARDATGGLLCRLGSRGLLVVKDMTTVLSMHRDTRGMVLAALREIYDGRWERNLGTDGGRSLKWAGRIAVVGACTTKWDAAHEVLSAMGDRFVLVRVDSRVGRLEAGRQALANTGQEVTMRQHLADAVGGLLSRMQPSTAIQPTEVEVARLFAVANVVTLARTAVERDYRGDVVDAHAPEMPTRFGKQLLQVMRGACAIGLDRNDALRLAIRCGRDSMPPLRLAIIEDVAANPRSRTHDVRSRLDRPRATVDRELQALHFLGLLTCDEVPDELRERSNWYYAVRDDIDVDSIRVPEMSVQEGMKTRREHVVTDNSGTRPQREVQP